MVVVGSSKHFESILTARVAVLVDFLYWTWLDIAVNDILTGRHSPVAACLPRDPPTVDGCKMVDRGLMLPRGGRFQVSPPP